MTAEGRQGEPPAQLVRYNDWRQVELPPLAEFRPEFPVSVIVPYYAQREELGRTFAALEGQTCPRELFEVVVVDDGSPEPLTEVAGRLFREAPFAVRTVRQEGLGFGAARARNTGARTAAHEVLLFLDADMLPEANWLLAHARWHQVLPDAVTLGLRAHVQMDEVDADAIRERPGTLKDLFAERPTDLVERRWYESYWIATNDLAAAGDDPFRVLLSASLGVRRGFFDLVGGFDESFTHWGGEDTEFGYRAFTRGGLFVPVRDGFAWHQGPWEEERAVKTRSLGLAMAKMTHLIAHPDFRSGASGRSFTVPQFVVTIPGRALPAQDLLKAVEHVLADPLHDLVVRLELPEEHADRMWLAYHLGPDPRVRVALPDTALLDFPNSPFQVTLPAGTPLHGDVVERLRTALGTAVLGQSVFPDGSRASIARAWALHRALRTQWEVSDFGQVVNIPPRQLGPWTLARWPAHRLRRRFLAEFGEIDGPRAAWRFVRWFGGAIPRRLRRARLARWSRARRSPGVEIVAIGARSRGVFEASAGMVQTAAVQTADLVVADTAADAAGMKAPTAVLEDSPPQFTVPALDPAEHNPIGWLRRVERIVGALGSLDRLPAGVRADCVVPESDGERIGSLRHLEDVEAFHQDAVARAATLARLAARGTLVHVSDEAPELEELLGADLYGLFVAAPPDSDPGVREALSIRIRRAALREHSLGSRVRQLCAAAGAEGPPLPLVSVLLVTKRPELLAHALAGVARQAWPRLELVLGIHGGGFAGVDERLRELPLPATAVRVEAEEPLGVALNRLAAAARGALLTKMDDDVAYGREHLWDLVLAQEYSQADLVSKTGEFVYLAESQVTIQWRQGQSEVRDAMGEGGAMLLPREVLRFLGGFPRAPGPVEQRLFERLRERGGRAYRTHGAGFVPVRRGGGASPEAKRDEWFLDRANRVWSGWNPERACIGDMARCWLPGFLEELC